MASLSTSSVTISGSLNYGKTVSACKSTHDWIMSLVPNSSSSKVTARSYGYVSDWVVSSTYGSSKSWATILGWSRTGATTSHIFFLITNSYITPETSTLVWSSPHISRLFSSTLFESLTSSSSFLDSYKAWSGGSKPSLPWVLHQLY